MGRNGTQGNHILFGKAFGLGPAELRSRASARRVTDPVMSVIYDVAAGLGGGMAWGRSHVFRLPLLWPRRAILPVARALVLLWLLQLIAAPIALAAPSAMADTLVKVVILSRHGVRSPIPSQAELETWTASTWPVWNCATSPAIKVCDSGELTPRGRALAEQMGSYYRTYLSDLFSPRHCPAPNDVFVWADRTERTEQTALALLRGFRPSCAPGKYFHTASTAPPDRIFHAVTDAGSCTLNAARAEREILARSGGNLSTIETNLASELNTTQK